MKLGQCVFNGREFPNDWKIRIAVSIFDKKSCYKLEIVARMLERKI